MLRAMAKDTAERYASAEDLRADLRRFREGSPVQAATMLVPPGADEQTRAVGAVPVAGDGATRAVPVTEGTRTMRRVEERYPEAPVPPPRSNTAFIVVLVAMLALLAGLLFLLATNLGLGDDTPEVTVPSVTDLPQAEAARILIDAGLEVGQVVEQEDPDTEPGIVIAQDPAPGESLEEGDAVNLTVSSGLPPVEVPRVVELTQRDAEGRLETNDLVPDFRPEESSDVEEGIVISQDPEGGEMVPPGTTVVVRVSSGPPTVTVPAVVGREQGDATNILSDAGFRPQVRQQEAAEPRGTVIATEPGPNASADEGSVVIIVVSTGPAPTTTAAPTTTTTTPTTTPTTTTTSLPVRNTSTTTTTTTPQDGQP